MKQKIVSLTIALIATITMLQAQCGSCNYTLPSTINASTTITGDNICNTGDVTITAGTTKFLHNRVYMNANARIIVKKGAILEIIGSRFLGCTAMWQGIDVEQGGRVIIDYYLDQPTLIEDAYIAINFTFDEGALEKPGVYTGVPLLIADNVIFNRNEIGIQITGYGDGIAPHLPNISDVFKIGNCIFTCRDILSNNYSLLQFPSVNTIKATTLSNTTPYPNTPASYNAPFINDIAYPDNNANAFLKTPFASGTTKSKYGIYLISAFFGQNGVVVGYNNGTQENAKTTIFDNQDVGIMAINSQLVVQNCTFQKPFTNTKGAGVVVDDINWSGVTTAPVFGYINIESPTGVPRNAFYDMNIAIECNGARFVQINNNDITSSQNVNNPSSNGNRGIDLILAEAVDINVNNNKIYNNMYGVLVFEDPSFYTPDNTAININNNTIQATNPSIPTAAPNNFVTWAMTVIGGGNTLGYYNERVVNCNSNILHNVQNGIMVNNWQGTNTHTDFNDITLKLDPFAQGNDYYGIWQVNGIPMDDNLLDPMGLPKTSGYAGNTVTGNTVVGNSDQEHQLGIFTQQQYGTNYGCNMVSNLEHGTKFNDMCYSTVFWDNWMDISNQYGFTLSQAIIGQQGTKAGKGTGACPSNNHWDGTNAQWLTNYSIPHYKTFNDNSYNVNSSFVVKSVPTEFNPNGCGKVDNTIVTGVFPYQHTATALSYTNTLLYAGTLQIDCGRCNGSASKMAPSVDEDANIETLEQIADETIELPADDADQRLYSLQQQLYDIVKAKPDLTVKSSELYSFAQANNWTTLDYIYYTGKYLAQDDANTADMLLSYWPQSSKLLDENYYQYYNWVTNMKLDKTYKPNLANVLALANKCPQKNGKVVYAARALYNGLTHTVHLFNNDCISIASRNAANADNNPNTITAISIYPNPSTSGVVNIKLKESTVKEVGHWVATVTDVYGKIVVNKNLCSLQTQINIGTIKGVYLISISNNVSGKSIINKIILQ